MDQLRERRGRTTAAVGGMAYTAVHSPMALNRWVRPAELKFLTEGRDNDG